MNLFMTIVKVVEMIIILLVVIGSASLGIWMLMQGDLFHGAMVVIAGQVLSCLAKIMMDHSQVSESVQEIEGQL